MVALVPLLYSLQSLVTDWGSSIHGDDKRHTALSVLSKSLILLRNYHCTCTVAAEKPLYEFYDILKDLRRLPSSWELYAVNLTLVMCHETFSSDIRKENAENVLILLESLEDSTSRHQGNETLLRLLWSLRIVCGRLVKTYNRSEVFYRLDQALGLFRDLDITTTPIFTIVVSSAMIMARRWE